MPEEQRGNCISHFKDDGKAQDQAVAICINDPKAHLAQKPCTMQRTAQILSQARLLTAQIEFASILKKKH